MALLHRRAGAKAFASALRRASHFSLLVQRKVTKRKHSRNAIRRDEAASVPFAPRGPGAGAQLAALRHVRLFARRSAAVLGSLYGPLRGQKLHGNDSGNRLERGKCKPALKLVVAIFRDNGECIARGWSDGSGHRVESRCHRRRHHSFSISSPRTSVMPRPGASVMVISDSLKITPPSTGLNRPSDGPSRSTLLITSLLATAR